MRTRTKIWNRIFAAPRGPRHITISTVRPFRCVVMRMCDLLVSSRARARSRRTSSAMTWNDNNVLYHTMCLYISNILYTRAQRDIANWFFLLLLFFLFFRARLFALYATLTWVLCTRIIYITLDCDIIQRIQFDDQGRRRRRRRCRHLRRRVVTASNFSTPITHTWFNQRTANTWPHVLARTPRYRGYLYAGIL